MELHAIQQDELQKLKANKQGSLDQEKMTDSQQRDSYSAYFLLICRGDAEIQA